MRQRTGFYECPDCGSLFITGLDPLLDCECDCALTGDQTTQPVAVLPVRKPRRQSRNAWREMVTEAHHLALLTWEQERDAVCIGYDWEETEWQLSHPRPTLKYMMQMMARQHEDAA